MLSIAAAAVLMLPGAVTVQAQSPQPHAAIRIAAAADLEPVLPPVLDIFEKKTGVKTEVSYGSSAQLAQQIQNGAPFDVFLSANMEYPQGLAAKGLAAKPVAYARGTLVLWALRSSPVQPLSATDIAHLLASDKLQKLAVANPAHAPYGKATQQFLDATKLSDAAKPKLVVAENIAQAAEFAATGNAQAGFISLTSALSEKFRQEGSFLMVPRDKYAPLLQGAAVVNASAHKPEAQKLVDFLTSHDGALLLQMRGLSSPAE